MYYAYKKCPCGELRGIGKNEYELFKGIPYANADRWEPPVPVTKWEGCFDATVQGKACPQRYAFEVANTPTAFFYRDENVEKHTILYSEDCLSLNIWTPKEGQDLPVLVYIHGGSYETGNGSTPAFSGVEYCRRGIILVTINYRLNAFSSAIGDGHMGNYGLQDQVCALEWINRNIAAFGGDPSKVTIMGESAGAMSVQNMIYTPMAKGLFRGAIMFSGGGILPRAFRIKQSEDMLALWCEIKDAFGASTIDDLKQIPPRELYLTWKKIYTSNPRYATPATPVIDGNFIPEHPRDLAQKGKVNAVPAILCVLSEDMWPHTLYEAILEWGEMMESIGNPPVYGAYFDRQVPESPYGAYHGCDVKYAFGTLDLSWRPYTDTDYRISQNLIDYCATFIKTGVPCPDNLAHWKPLGKSQQQFMHFGDEPCDMVNVPAQRLQATEEKGKPFPAM